MSLEEAPSPLEEGVSRSDAAVAQRFRGAALP
jgi:hypothetical protein